jgi:HSP20 family protein
MSIRKRVGYLVPMGYWGTSSVLKEMERMIDDLKVGFNEMVPYGGSEERLPMVDILDEGERYVVEAELPGVKKEEVSIDVGEDSITIEAKRESEVEEKKEGYVRKEREHMSFYRRVPLPDDADSSKATAKLENGLLTIALPKKEKALESKRKLEIE